MGSRVGLVHGNSRKTETGSGSARACCCPHCSDCHMDMTVCPQVLLEPLRFVFTGVLSVGPTSNLTFVLLHLINGRFGIKFTTTAAQL